MKKAILFCSIFSFVAAIAAAQTYTAPAPAPVSIMSAAVHGTPGKKLYCYWVVANYPTGAVISDTRACVVNGPTSLTESNYVTITWTGTAGASSYDVLWAAAKARPSANGSIAVATATGSTTANDTGTHSAYTFATKATASTGSVTLDNKTYGEPTLVMPYPTAILRSIAAALPGSLRAIRGEYTIGNLTSGTLTGVRGAVTLPTNKTVTSGYLYGAQGKVILNGTSNTQSGGGIIAGVFGQLDTTGGTITNTGLTAPLAGDVGGTGVNATVENVHGLLLTNSTNTKAGSAIHLGTTSGGFERFLSIDDSSNTVAVTTGSPGTCTNSGYLKVIVNSTELKIPFCQ